MGRMKEVFQQMREENWEGTPEEYLQHYVARERLIETKDSLCPSCFDNMITHKPNDEVSCNSCNQQYSIKNNRLKFIDEKQEDIDDFCPDLDENGDIDTGRDPRGDYLDTD